MFGMVAAKVKMNANGAHTFLEVRTPKVRMRAPVKTLFFRSSKFALGLQHMSFSHSMRLSASLLCADLY
jgi:hypothetical protein